uniref:Protein TIC 214 n=1 Tax=Galeopsis tetrahit TaxID=1000418 RepID=A0A2K9RIU8_GALTE|nr:Ycf1 [Galeopsis tetrahit]AUT82045.1 Ycf1 [Galeopsis tetrahit]
MIFQSFLLGNLVSLCMKIINSVVVVGLYYGFLTTFSTGPSYLFLLRAQVMEEGTEKKVSATTGFITGQLMMFISIYYAPLHLALGRPHTITVLALPYLLFHFFWNNHKHFFDSGSTTRNSMRNFSIQCLFLNNLIFQLFNHFILPSSMLARLVNIYMFRCNNKMLFVTSSFVGWLIGHILFMKWLGLVLVWIRQNHSIRSNVLIRSNKYLVSELRNSTARIWSILLFITCVYYLGRIPSPLFSKKLKETSKTGAGERVESEEERDVEIETASEMKGTKQEQEGSTEEDPSLYFFSEERADPNKIDETEEMQVNGKEKEFHFRFTETGYQNRPVSEESYLMNINENQDNSRLKIFDQKTENKELILFDKPLVTILFDSKRWNRPFRYIKNKRFEKAVRNEMSQYFFDICQSDGKARISFTYPPSLSIFLEMINKRISPPTIEKFSFNELSNPWVYNNKQKVKNLNNEFINRIKALDKENIYLNILETRTRLCNDDSTKEYLSKGYDPFLNGSYRKTIYKSASTSTLKKTLIENFLDQFGINRIHGILLSDTDYQEFEQKINRFEKKSLSRQVVNFFTFISKFVKESGSTNLNRSSLSLSSEGKIDSHKETKYFNYLLNLKKILTDANGQKMNRKLLRINEEINKKLPRWSYTLITELEQQSRDKEDVPIDHQIRSRRGKRVVIFTATKEVPDPNSTNSTNSKMSDPNTTNTKMSDDIRTQRSEGSLIRYSQQPDFRRGIIKGSMRAQRRKVVIFELFQANVHSPLFLERLPTPSFFSFDISGLIKLILKHGLDKGEAFKIVEYTKEQTKREEKKEQNKRKEKARIKVAESWDRIPFAQGLRGCVLLTQSIFRKYIVLPSLIIAKNIGRIFLLQLPEWSEDFEEWNKEIHIKCTYNGIPLSETEFPKNWFTDGIQIKILFPFCLKPSQKSKLRSSQKDLMKKKKQKGDFCFLTVWGMETELPFCAPRKKPSFFKPIFKEFEKKIGKCKQKYFRVLTVFKGKTKLLRKVSKETNKWVIKSFFFIKRIIKELSKVNPIQLFRLREVGVYESSEIKEEKDSIINNQTIHESFSQITIASPSWTNSSLTEKKMKDLANRTSTIRNQIERITKEKKKVTPRINNLSPTSSNAKKSEKQQMLKRRNAPLICKLPPLFKFFIEKLCTDTFLSIINIPRINTEFFLKLTKKMSAKSIYNNERKQERINKKKKTSIPVLSSLKNPLNNISNITKNSHIFYDLSYVPQGYVFYKLAKIQVSNSLRSVFQYQGIPFFLKPKIKDSFEIQGILDSKSADNKLSSYEMNPWKRWLRRHSQYHLSQIGWSRLIPEKWRNAFGQQRIAKKANFSKRHSYEKKPLMNSKKQKQFEVYSLSNQKENFLKYYRYDLLSYKFINYEKKKESFFYGSPFQGNTNQEIYYNTPKKNFFDMLRNIPIQNDLGRIHMEKPADIKYFDWKIFKFDLIQKVDIEAWILIDTNRNQNTQIRTQNSQIICKKDFFYLKIPEINLPNSHKGFFDWMGMNEKMLKHPISNLELWFFPEFLLLYKTYKMKPWFIPSKLLLLNRKRSENKKINEKEKGNFLLGSNKKHRNQEEKEPTSRGERRSVLSQQKDIEENYARSKMKKGKKKKQYTKPELHFFLKRYLLFQLRWGRTLKKRMINNINVYCLLLKLIDTRKITISSIQKKEMSLDIMMITKNLTLSEFMKKGVLILEPTRLSEQKDGQFIMYQTIGISLVDKNKHQKYQEQGHPSNNNFDETISSHQPITGNRDKNNFDLLVPENILSFRRRRKLRILICFNSKNRNSIDQNLVVWNVKNRIQVSHDNNHLDRDKNQLMKLKLFLWLNYRLEDLACMNRYWFDTNNGSRFGMLRIEMYPRLQIF